VGEINVDCGRRISMVADSRLELQDCDAVNIYAGGVRYVAFGSPGRPGRGRTARERHERFDEYSVMRSIAIVGWEACWRTRVNYKTVTWRTYMQAECC